MKKLVSWLLLLTIFLSGCGKIEVNDACIPLCLGADYRDNQLIVSAQLTNPINPEKSGGDTKQFRVVTVSGKTFTEAARNISLSLSTVPLWSHTQLSVLGENLAQDDISPVIDFLARNRYARMNNLMVLAHKASPEEIISVKPILEPYTAIAIKNILKKQETQLGIYTPVDTTEILHRLASPGIEPVIPMITIDKQVKEDKLLLVGMAVFKKTRMIGSLNETESRGYHLMRPKMITGGLFLIPSPLNDNTWITIELSRSQAKITPQIKGREIKMKIEIIAEGNFYEQGGSGNLFTLEMFKQIEKASEQELEKQIGQCIKKAQILNSDILGWGEKIYRSDPDTWDTVAADWDQTFPDVPYELNVSFALRRSYLTNKSFVFR